MGRPTLYNDKRPSQAEFICEHWGADDLELAKALGISPATLYEWKHEHPEFLESVERGKAGFDNARVAKSILESAVGYTYEEECFDSKSGQIVRLKKRRHGDPRSQALWMLNRQGWRPPGTGQRLLEAASGPDEPQARAVDPEELARAEEEARAYLEFRHQTVIDVPNEEAKKPESDQQIGETSS